MWPTHHRLTKMPVTVKGPPVLRAHGKWRGFLERVCNHFPVLHRDPNAEKIFWLVPVGRPSLSALLAQGLRAAEAELSSQLPSNARCAPTCCG